MRLLQVSGMRFAAVICVDYSARLQWFGLTARSGFSISSHKFRLYQPEYQGDRHVRVSAFVNMIWTSTGHRKDIPEEKERILKQWAKLTCMYSDRYLWSADHTCMALSSQLWWSLPQVAMFRHKCSVNMYPIYMSCRQVNTAVKNLPTSTQASCIMHMLSFKL